MNALNWELLTGPVVGGIIGYITNGIAIKMLFRPLKAIYLFGVKLPFTPGIMPKEKGRIAKSIGQVVSRELINEEVLTKVLLQENIYSHINEKIDDMIEQYQASKLKVRGLGEKLLDTDTLEKLTVQVEEAISKKIYTKVLELNLGKLASENLLNKIEEGFDKSIFGAFALFINDNFLKSIAEKLEPIINKVVEEQGEPIITNRVEKEIEGFLDQSIADVAVGIKDNSEIIKRIVEKSYTHFVQHNLSQALQIIDLSKVVEDRINAFDTLELEKVILEIMQKELNAIIWLGALLGAILGCIMSIV